MPGAARAPISLNWNARRRELERINHENRGIVTLQGRESNLGPRSQWRQRSDDHDRHLMMLRRPATSHGASLPTPFTHGCGRMELVCAYALPTVHGLATATHFKSRP